MKKQQNNLTEVEMLRQKAEELLKNKSPKTTSINFEAKILKLFHELEVYQIELEMQNKELLQVKEQVEIEAQKYAELYDCAPSGYFTLSKDGKIIELNFSGANMLGKERQHIKNSRFGFFISNDTKPIFNLFLSTVFNSKVKQSCEVTILTDCNLQTYVYLSGQVTKNSEQCYLTMIDITDRKLAEEKLRESEERFQLLFNKAPLGYQSLDIDGNFIEVNQQWLETLGYTNDEVLGKWFGDFLSPSYQDGFRKRFPIFKAEGKIHSEFEMVHKNGNKIFIAFEGRIGYDANGEFKQTHCILQDITKFKQGQEKLLFISKAIEAASDAIGISDAQGHHFYQNKALTDMFGYSTAGEMESLGGGAIVVKDPEVAKEMFGNIMNGKSWSGELEMVTKSGYVFPAYERADAIKDSEGNIIGLIGLINDITERKQAEEALHESEEKYSKAFLTSPYAITITSMEDGKFIEVNDAFTSVSGFTKEEVITNSAVGLNMWVDKEEQKYVISTLLEGRDVAGKEFLFKRKNGEIVNSLFYAKIIKIKNKPHIISIINDVTELKQTELELINAKEKAEESDKLKSAFLSNMSHEIRTPMNGILGFAELLKKPQLTGEEQQDFIRTIEMSGARMLNIINNIVDVSKIESGLIKVDIKESNINEQIEFVYNFFKPEVESKGMQFSFENGLPSKEAIIKTDIEKFYAILTNLVKNAIKFTNKGSIEFGYKKKGKYLEFFVKDTGIGISQKHKDLIFERFRQGSNSLTRNYEGAGLGLSISKSYVEMLEGKIWVESEEGKSSIFYFTIPYNVVSEEKYAIKNAFSGKDKEVETKNLKILVAEDDETSYSLMSITLQKISHEVLHAKTGVEAIESCHNNPDIDLVLMDIRMPDMDGYEATCQIRQFNKDVIIIAQTAYGFSSDREKAIEAGCNDYISKPINSTLLYELIKKHFNK